MAKCGNHGQIIPRDRELMYRLYVVEKKTLTEMARMFGVTNHQSVGNVLRQMGFHRPGQGCRPLKTLCIDCGLRPPKVLKHKLTRNGTGTRCLECLRKYKAAWTARATRERPEVKRYRKEQLKRWYETGPINPKGEKQWITKAKHLLRSAKRTLATRVASQSRSAASAPGPISLA